MASRLCEYYSSQTFAFSKVRSDPCALFLISAHNQFKPRGKVGNTLRKEIFTFSGGGFHISLCMGLISACAKLKPQSKFGLELFRAKLLREFLPSRISMKIGSGRKRKRASPMFCRNLFQSQNKPFTCQPFPGWKKHSNEH